MSEVDKTQKPNNSSDEIDLRELFTAIGNFFSNIFLNIILFIVAIKNAILNNIKLIVILGLLGGIGGIIVHFVTPDIYKSSILLRSTYLSGRLMESSIDKLDLLTKEDNRTQLAKVLKIDTATANNIIAFSYEPFVSEEEVIELEIFKEQLRGEIEDEEVINRFVERLSMDNKSTYRIFVEVLDRSIINDLEEPLLNYFKENPFVSKRLKIQEQNLKLEAENIEGELAELDSLKEILFKNFRTLGERDRDGSNNVILADEQTTNPISVFNESRKAYEKKLDIQRQLFLEPQFELIDGFTVYSQPASAGLIKLGFYGGLTGLGIAGIIIALSLFLQYLDKIEQKTRQAKEDLKRRAEAKKI
ncbi:hypothetical protein MATR_36870 [Marivirga tractuosa]|uniref:Uncharacterized protein n=1 Tax=Marivirga tractuosa (strain ATCC 23168 / DSM 4126 / NBRC 15989 / NCIMB 1408 / VKM B-1430 / H-43) TaxID=643867 RepID=E4TN53_MARTH|nr:hypothetical protein [Marivirga tractuosa]ADR22467.1 hypothetical protein Ftrac_2489 [Marivirga tractuosa DSM 4126]BDD16862.1 hypothetical protein MATR_36870 [Marivirga tractuosa]